MEHVLTKPIPREYVDDVEQQLSENREDLESYIDLLLWWNKKINLISRSVSRETLQEHVRHSLIISVAKAFRSSDKILDTGTGGGLPGIPLSIINPQKKFVLNDIVEKKLLACKNIIRDLGLKNITTTSGSIQNVEVVNDQLVITKHAFKINELYEMIEEKPWRNLILLKGSEEVLQELEGIEERLKIEIWELDKTLNSAFYKGKALVEIKRLG